MKKLLVVVALVLGFVGEALAQKSASPPIMLIGPQGRPLPDGQVNITDLNGLPVITWMDRAGTATFNGVLPPDGLLQFFANPASYVIRVSGGGVSKVFQMDIGTGGGGAGCCGLVDNDFPYDPLPGQFSHVWTGTLARMGDLFKTIRYEVVANDPQVTDDASEGFIANSIWINSGSNRAWINTNGGTANNAIWVEISGGGGGSITGGVNLTSNNKVFESVAAGVMRFRTLLAGAGVTITENATTIEIASNSGGLPAAISNGDTLYYNGTTWVSTNTTSIQPGRITAGAPLVQMPNDTGTAASFAAFPNASSGVSLELSSLDTDIQANDGLGRIQFRGLDTNASPTIGAIIRAKADDIWTPGDTPTRLEFYTPGTVDGFTIPKQVIDDLGFVRIGRLAASVAYDPTAASGANPFPEKIHVNNGIRFVHEVSAATIGIKISGSAVGNSTYYWPDADGNPGQAITTDGAGNLSFADSAIADHATTHDIGGGDEVAFYGEIEDEDIALTRFRVLNFEGGGVNCADDATKTTCTIPGGGGGSLSSINGQADAVQFITTNSAGLDFAITQSGTDTNVISLPVASLTAAGKVSISAQTFAGLKSFDDGVQTNSDGGGTGSLKAVGDNTANLLFANPATDSVGIRAAPTSVEALVVTPSNAMNGILVNNPASPRGVSAMGLTTAVEGITTTGSAFEAFATTGVGYKAALTTDAKAATLTRNHASSSKSVVEISQLHGSDTASALSVLNANGNSPVAQIIRDSASTGAVSSSDLRVYARTTGVPAIGLGPSIGLLVESSTGVDTTMVNLRSVSTDLTNGSVDGYLALDTIVAGATREIAQFGSADGDFPFLPAMFKSISSVNNGVNPVLELQATTGAVAAVGFGGQLKFKNEVADGSMMDAASVTTQWVDLTPSAEEARLDFNVTVSGGLVRKQRIEGGVTTHSNLDNQFTGSVGLQGLVTATQTSASDLFTITQNGTGQGIALVKNNTSNYAMGVATSANGINVVPAGGAAGTAYNTATGVGTAYDYTMTAAGVGYKGTLSTGAGQLMNLTSASNSASGNALVQISNATTTADRNLVRYVYTTSGSNTKPVFQIDPNSAAAPTFSVKYNGFTTVGVPDPSLVTYPLLVTSTTTNGMRISNTTNTSGGSVFDVHQSEVADFAVANRAVTITQFAKTSGAQEDNYLMEYIADGGNVIFAMETDGMPLYPAISGQEAMPTVTSCGTAPSITGRNAGGHFTIGTGTVTACTLTLQESWTNGADCTFTGGSANSAGVWITSITNGASTTAIVINSLGNMAGDTIRYACMAMGV